MRIPLAEAEALAVELVALLRPACERVEIAGSIRRRKADVGDVEIVAAPRFAAARDLFGGTAGVVNCLDDLVSHLEAAGTLTRRVSDKGATAWGSRLKRALYKGFPVDLFAAFEPATFGVIHVIRTGSAEFSHRLVTPRRLGGMLPDWAQVKDGAIWHRDGTKMPTPEEEDVFALLGIPVVPPEARSA